MCLVLVQFRIYTSTGMTYLNASRVKMVIMRPNIERTLPTIEKALRGLLCFGGDLRAFTSYHYGKKGDMKHSIKYSTIWSHIYCLLHAYV